MHNPARKRPACPLLVSLHSELLNAMCRNDDELWTKIREGPVYNSFQLSQNFRSDCDDDADCFSLTCFDHRTRLLVFKGQEFKGA